MTEWVSVEVCYALLDEQRIVKLDVPAGSSLLETIAASHIANSFPQIDLTHAKFGVFGKLRKLSDTVNAGDRIEIYRELSADPKAVRHQRVEQARVERARIQSRPKR